MISSEIINRIKYIGIERYEKYKSKFDKLDENELIELKAEYEANVNANGSKVVSAVLISILGFIACGVIGTIGKFIYELANYTYKSNHQQALNLISNFIFLAGILVLVIFITLILYNKAVKKNYVKLYYINQYLKDKEAGNLNG